MPVAVIDTGILIGLAGADDDHNGAAGEIVRGVDHGDLPTGRVTNYVVLAALNWVHNRQHSAKAIETYRRLHESAGFEIVHAAQKDSRRAVDSSRPAKVTRVGDATIAAHVERENVEYLYSFDDDFDALGHVSRLETAADPFD